MRKSIGILITSLIFVIVQNSFLLEFFGSALNPNLVIAFCFSFILLDDYQDALLSALIGGLFIDLLGTSVVGLSSFLLILLLVLTNFIKKTIFRGIWVPVLFILISTVVFKIVSSYPNIEYGKLVIYSGLINICLSFLFYFAVRRIQKRFLSSEYRIKS